MKFVLTLFILTLFIFVSPSAFAQRESDTVVVNLIEFTDHATGGYRRWFEMPEDGESYERLWLQYRLKCPTWNCGQWDYLAYIFASKPTGTYDTLNLQAPRFRVNGQAVDTFAYRTDTAWFYSWNTTTMQTDSSAQILQRLVRFDNEEQPTMPTDTMIVWPPYWRKTYTSATDVDSVWVGPDETLLLTYWEYIEYRERLDRFEIARYITPYGSQLPRDWDFTWYIDVTDYMPLLKDSVYIDANSLFYGWIPGGFSQLLEMKLLKIKGTPVRKPLEVQRLWNGGPVYGIADRPIEEFLAERTVAFPAEAEHTRLKLRVTGHGFGDMENCAEFCKKEHEIEVNGIATHTVVPWRPDCGLNPVYPQNGTWIYDRAGWCPGDVVGTHDLEFYDKYAGNTTHAIDYNVQDYVSRPRNNNSTPYWQIETQLVHYAAPSFQVDAAVEEIISPSRRNVYHRMNPICDHPVVVIRNTGADTLTSLKIRFGTREGRKYTHEWTGMLPLAATDTVQLGPLEWGDWVGNSTSFDVEVLEPNGMADQYARNNRMSSTVDAVERMDGPVEVIIQGNNAARETSWEVRDANDSLLLIRPRGQLTNQTRRRDTLDLAPGCYRLTVMDSDGDGLDFGPYNQDGRGDIIVRDMASGTTRFLEPNFGRAMSFSFTVGYDMYDDTLNLYTRRNSRLREVIGFDVYPNPANDKTQVQLTLSKSQTDLSLEVRDATGKLLYVEALPAGSFVNHTLSTDMLPAGLYLLRISGSGLSEGRRLLIAR